MICHFNLYVSNQKLSTQFYQSALALQPTLEVPGMTEFTLGNGWVLGLMPETGIKRLLGSTIQDPQGANGIPRAEVYLLVTDPINYLERALAAGAKLLSSLAPRDWGHESGYCLDPDGHVLAFGKVI